MDRTFWTRIYLSHTPFLSFRLASQQISGALLLLKDHFRLDTFQQEVVVALTVGGAFVGSLGGGYLASRLGRKLSIIVASLIFMAGAGILAGAISFAMLCAGEPELHPREGVGGERVYVCCYTHINTHQVALSLVWGWARPRPRCRCTLPRPHPPTFAAR